MAGDWIKMRVGLHEDPAVIGMAAQLKMDEYAVIGRLHRIWSWATAHTSNGNAHSVTPCNVDVLVNAPGFAEAMVTAGWLKTSEAGISFPKFDRHMSQGAKSRALTQARVQKLRNAASVTDALPEKRRVEKRRIDKLKRVGGGGTGAFRALTDTEDGHG